jgi:hypothetical protein
MPRLAAFPRSGNAYTECLYEALTRKGIEILEGDFSIRWLNREVKTVEYFTFTGHHLSTRIAAA